MLVQAPEVLRDREGKGHTETVDIWAFGILLFMLLTQEVRAVCRLPLTRAHQRIEEPAIELVLLLTDGCM